MVNPFFAKIWALICVEETLFSISFIEVKWWKGAMMGQFSMTKG